MKYLKLLVLVLIGSLSQAQQDKNILHNIIEAVSENRLNEDIKTLAGFTPVTPPNNIPRPP